MTLLSALYTLDLDITYTSTGNATTAQTSINSALSGIGRAETVTRNSAQVTLNISGLTESEVVAIRSAIWTPWTSMARTVARISVVRTN